MDMLAKKSDYRTSHQVLYHLGQHFNHSYVTNTSQGHGGGREDEISNQDSLKESKINHIYILKNIQEIWTDFSLLTFLSPHILLMVFFPLRLSDPSMTSSCTRLAVWIISEIIAMALCPGSKSLQRTKADDRSHDAR